MKVRRRTDRGEGYASGLQRLHEALLIAKRRSDQEATNLASAHTVQKPGEMVFLILVRNIKDRNVATSYQTSGGKNGVYLAEPRMVGLRGNFYF